MDTDIVVVGTGAAGLAAALQLTRCSLRVIAVDARGRVGGRVMWQSVGSVDVPAELGAEFIHGEAPETSALLTEAGLDKVETGEESWTCSASGKLQPSGDDFRSADVFERIRSCDRDESVESFPQRLARDPGMREEARRARAFVEGFEAADPALASARAIADEIKTGVDSTSSRPARSYAPLFDHLATRCARAGVDLRLRTAVERIGWEPGKVSIEARSERAGALTLRARCAVVTVPVGVLRQRNDAARLSFAPALPAEKQAALRSLEMGHVVRVTLAFRTPFWEDIAGGRYRDAAFFRCEEGPFNAFWTQMPVRSRTVVAWAGGPRAAAAMDGASAQDRIERARDAFGAIFGECNLACREFEAGVTHDWSADPFAGGAYSYVVTGGGQARAALGTPVDDTLFFAGEATSTDGQGGTVSGAFESGMRVASEVARALDLAAAPSRIVP
jgi:monoamine oxidase